MSRRAIDLTGQRFGRLLAIRDIGSRRAFRVWEFRCDCGAVAECTTASVLHGGTISCGCFQREESSRRKSADMLGMRFGRLIVVARSGLDKHGKVQWRCKCDCGDEPVVSGASLRREMTKSCGCLHRELLADRQRAKTLPPDIERANVMASAAKQRAKRKQNPIAVMQSRLSRLHRHALAQVGAIKTSPTFAELGYSAKEFVVHIERQFLNGMGWHNMPE